MKQFDESMKPISEFEQELAQAMYRVDAPEGFADRVLARVAEPEPRRAKVLVMPRRVYVWASGAIAAAVLAGVFAGHEVRLRHEREVALRAQQQLEAQQQFELAVQITDETLADARAHQQFDVAMQITGKTLANVRAQLQQAGVPVGE